MKYEDIKKIQKICKKHKDAYSVGLYTTVDNTYDPKSEKYYAFNEGRRIRNAKEQRKQEKYGTR